MPQQLATHQRTLVEWVKGGRFFIWPIIGLFLLTSAVILVAGVALEMSGSGLADLAGINGVVFGATGGVMADHFDRRRLIVTLDLARAALMALLCVVAGSASSVTVLLIVLVTYTLATPYRPAVIAGIPLVVGENDAAAANALDGVVRQVVTFLGPLLGVAVLWLGGPSWAFACNAVSIGRTVIVNAATPAFTAALAAHGFAVEQSPLGEFMKAGGSAKCLTLDIS